MLRMRARQGLEAEFEMAWARAAAEISRVPGNVRQELSRDVDDSRTFVITSEWIDRAAVDAFGRSDQREALTAGLRDLREDAARSTYELLSTVPATKPLPIRIDLTTRVSPGEEEAFEHAYAIVASRLAGTPGLIREELLKEPGSFVYHIFAEWESEQDFINWVEDPSHADQSGPLARWLSVEFARRVFEIRYRPAQHQRTPGTPEFPAVQQSSARPAIAPPLTAPARAIAVAPTLTVEAAATPAPAPSPAPTAAPAATSAPSRARNSATRNDARDVDVLVVGGGPVGLTCAIELARRGIAVRVIDKRPEAAAQADKAIGIHCRTMEIWEDQGVVAEAIRAGVWLHGQTVFVNGKLTHQVDWAGLSDLPYAHLGLPQYETERILSDRLASLGVTLERGVELTSFQQDADGVAATLKSTSGATTVTRAQYLVGCDGGHSAVRAGLGLQFEGGLSMFPQLFMLGDVQLDWTMPPGHLLRFVRIEDDGDFTGMLVCVPLRGRGRYRVATLAPQPLQKTIGSGVVPAGFWQEYTPPTLADIQAVLDDLAPEPTTASNLRWSSIFRIKHGIVDRYRADRVFVAGDAAHLHPPAGGQGLNTGIQDAWNLGWKLALAVRGIAAPALLDSYDAERRPAGKAIVDRAVALAFTDEMDMEDEKAQFLLEMQMTMNYAGSALVGEEIGPAAVLGGPAPGERAPDVQGLTRFGVGHNLRLFDLTRGTRSTLLLYADETVNEGDMVELDKLATAVWQRSSGEVEAYLITSRDAQVPAHLDVPVLRDSAGNFRRIYDGQGLTAYLIRPDGHVGYRSAPATLAGISDHLQRIFIDAPPTVVQSRI
ncbi:FAD-dependent oxidoreductase [Microbacterium sp.]|uniref:FAD-dependent oxidoreductase n=1 Tax=Microbacterium sp. TaxID=51671 RepID=UPI002E3054A1|nr:FAD-dependent oxidoreductase [Microbacterium sp.]HEX5727882.1 FAD-dependent oxidoreductase [Microbacterium sp.]